MWNSLGGRWAALELHNRLYFVATVLFILPLVLQRWLTRGALPELALLPSILMFTCGYVAWWVPEFLRIWRSDIRKLPLILVHAALYPICAGFARVVVSKATGLPPQSLDLTVNLLALLSYPIGWGCIFVFRSVLYGAWLFIYSMWLSHPFSLPGILSSEKAEHDGEPKVNSWWTGLHAIGAFSACALITFIAQDYVNELHSEPFVRLIAYVLDFENAEKYPGIDHSRRMRLLDNQYVAYAEPHGFDVKITVEKLHN